MKSKRLILFTSIVIMLTVDVFAQGTWTTYTCSNDINDIKIQGTYFWYATSGGVVRWNSNDGTFEKYFTTDGLAHNFVTSLDIGSDGVHLGQDDMSISKARKIIGNERIIGLSTHSIEQAIAAAQEDIDYVGYGPVFATKTKPWAEPIGTTGIAQFKKALGKPVFVIGGINMENIRSVMDAGADGVAIVSSIWESKDWRNAITSYLELIQHHHLDQSHV